MLLTLLHKHDTAGHLPPPTHQPIIEITNALPAIAKVMLDLPLPTTPVTPQRDKLHLAFEGPELSSILGLEPSTHPAYPKAALDITYHQDELTLEYAIKAFQDDTDFGLGAITNSDDTPSAPDQLNNDPIASRVFAVFTLLREPPAPDDPPRLELGTLQLHYDSGGFVLAPIMAQTIQEDQTNMRNTLADAAGLLMAYFTSENLMPFQYQEATTHMPYQQRSTPVTTRVLKTQ